MPSEARGPGEESATGGLTGGDALENDPSYRLLLDNLPNIIVVKTDTALRCQFIGGGAITTGAVDARGFLGRTLSAIYERYGIHRATELLAHHQAALAGHTSSLVFHSPRTGDEYETTVLPLPGDDGQIAGTMLVATNVTARRDDQREIRRLAEVVAASGEAIMSSDADGRITSANAHACTLFRYGRAEMCDLAPGALTPPDQVMVLAEAKAEVMAGRAWRGEAEQLRSDGTRFWASVTLSPMRGLRDEVVGMSIILHDISDRKETEARLAAATQRLGQILEHAPIGMALVGIDGRWLQVNRTLCELVGYREDELLAKTYQDITHPDDLDTDLELSAEVVAGRRHSYTMEKRYYRSDGSLVWVLLTVSLVHDEAGRPLHFISQLLDISDRKRNELRLQNEADRDPLTDLLNRRRFIEVLTHTLDDAKQIHRPITLLFIDLDGFKVVNDTFGHHVGDEVLKSVGNALRGTLRSSDTISRYGGDEFVVLLDDVTQAAAEVIAAKLRDAVAACGVPGDAESELVSASIGVATFEDPAMSPNEVLAAADRSMYVAKRARQ